jgi:hypothetical protein
MKGIPSKESIVVTIISLKGDIFCITTTILQDTYYIYRVQNNAATKLGSGKNPIELEDKYIGEREKLLKRLEKLQDE